VKYVGKFVGWLGMGFMVRTIALGVFLGTREAHFEQASV